MEDVHGQEVRLPRLDFDRNDSEANLVQTPQNVHTESLLLLFAFLIHVTLEPIFAAVSEKRTFHNELKPNLRSIRIHSFERFNMSSRVDVDSQHMVRPQLLVRLYLEVNIVCALFQLQEAIDTLMVPLHILSVVKVKPLEGSHILALLLFGHPVLDIGIPLELLLSFRFRRVRLHLYRIQGQVDIEVQESRRFHFQLEEIEWFGTVFHAHAH